MAFAGFEQQDFDTFSIDGLDERMVAIQERIQPKFREIGNVLTDDLSAMIGSEMYLHIAKHARRTVNPPQDTWLAIAGNKRGYKKHPHFQVGLFDDHVFIWLAFIYELPNKAKMAQNFLDHIETVKETIPQDFMISQDHMKKEATSIREVDVEKVLTRFRDVKKAEFLVGKHIDSKDPLLKDGNRFLDFTKNIFETLIPLYRLAYQ
ncbi:DUF1054 domain-containing protein [Lederbergia sp. NSJ-179]|uniref:YktB family protein n=1 Tax=Lederbergia sp. NSJ-179 TaxID=2931402 RepID=UPI001FD071FC|nr:DUF1054 domain-containing protein [Lederbergia sp. NSJ-179]MCJ7840726.1 DUF1054 domain-containing protein [Lederbergia sp. NSJ-179]